MSFPFVVQDLPFWRKGMKRPIIKWGRRGVLAVSNGEFITFYLQKNEKLEILSCVNLFNSPITAMEWSEGFDSTGFLPALLFVAAENGKNAIFDIKRSNLISEITHEKDVYTVSSAPSLVNPFVFYIATTKNSFFRLDFRELSAPVFSMETQLFHSVDYISINPNNLSEALCASKSGHFTVITNIRADDGQQKVGPTMQFSRLEEEVSSCHFYPYLANSLYLVTTTGIFIYTLSDDVFTQIYETDSHGESLYDAFFPDTTMHIIVIVHRTHINLARVNKTLLEKPQRVNSPFDFSKLGFDSAMAIRGNQIAFASNGQMMLINIEGETLVVKSIMKQLNGKPEDFMLYKNTFAVVTDNGQLGIIENQSNNDKQKVNSPMYTKHFSLVDGTLHSVDFLSQTDLIVAGTTKNQKQKVFLVSTKTGIVKSLLKAGQEIIGTEPPIITVAPKRNYFAVSLAGCIILIFNSKGEKITTIFEEEAQFYAFNGSSDELWLFNASGVMNIFAINNKEVEKIDPVSLDLMKGQISCVKATREVLCVGTTNGKFIHFSWTGEALLSCQVSKKPLKGIYPYQSVTIITDSLDRAYQVNALETMDTHPLNTKITKLSWASSEYAYVKLIDSESISTVQTNDLQTKSQLIPSHLLDHPAIEQHFTHNEKYKASIKNAKTPSDMVRINEEFGYCAFADVYKALSNILTPISYNLTTNMDSIIDYLSVANDIFIGSRDEERALTRRLRYKLLMRNDSSAFDLLLLSTPGSDFFERNVLKASIIGMQPPAVSAVVAALVGNGSIDTAVDVVMITHQWGHASRILMSANDFETALQIAVAVADEKDCKEIIKAVARNMVHEGNNVGAAALFLVIGEKDEAIEATKDLFKLPLLPDEAYQGIKKPTAEAAPESEAAAAPAAQPTTTTTKTVVTKRIIKRKAKKSTKASEDHSTKK